MPVVPALSETDVAPAAVLPIVVFAVPVVLMSVAPTTVVAPVTVVAPMILFKVVPVMVFVVPLIEFVLVPAGVPILVTPLAVKLISVAPTTVVAPVTFVGPLILFAVEPVMVLVIPVMVFEVDAALPIAVVAAVDALMIVLPSTVVAPVTFVGAVMSTCPVTPPVNTKTLLAPPLRENVKLLAFILMKRDAVNGTSAFVPEKRASATPATKATSTPFVPVSNEVGLNQLVTPEPLVLKIKPDVPPSTGSVSVNGDVAAPSTVVVFMVFAPLVSTSFVPKSALYVCENAFVVQIAIVTITRAAM